MDDPRFPVPFEMAALDQTKQGDAVVLLDVVEQAVASANLAHVMHDGSRFFLRQEVVVVTSDPDSPEETAFGLTRPDWGEDEFVLESTDGSEESVVTPSEDGKHLQGEGLERFRSLAQAIGSGALAGAHTVTILKMLDPGHIDRPAMLEVALTRRSEEGVPAVTTSVDLRFLRYYDNQGSMYTQIGRFEYDPNAGEVRSGDTCLNEQWIPSSQPGVDEELLADPMPEESGRFLQYMHRPLLMVDRPPTIDMWTTLVSQPLQRHDLLQN